MTATIPKKKENQPSSRSPAPPGTAAGSTTCVAERVVPANLTLLRPKLLLPPGVYFSPTKAESILTYLNRWIAGVAMPDAARWIVEADVYGESPDALARKHRPASTRDSEGPSWWFLCHCKLQAARGGRTRGDRRVATGGYWKLEQTSQAVACPATGRRLGFKRNFGFYVSHGRSGKEEERPKTLWLMEEYTSVACPEDGVARSGDGKKVVPALYRMYFTPRDSDKKEIKKRKRGRDDDDDDDDEEKDGGAHSMGDGPGRSVVPEAYFDAVAALLSPPPSRVLGLGKEQTKDAQAEAPPAEPSVFDLSHDITPSKKDCSWIGHLFSSKTKTAK